MFVMQEIHSNQLWIGNALDIRSPQGLFDVGISAVVDLAYEEPSAQLPRQFVYCRFPLVDGDGNDCQLVAMAVRTIVDLLQSNTSTVVACSAGMSRSPTIASFALARYLGKEPKDVASRIANVKALEINPALWANVTECLQDL